MKVYTRTNYRYTADVWVPTVLNDANGTIVYEYDRSIRLTMTNGRGQNYMHTQEEVPYGSMLRNVKDRTGRFIFAHSNEQYDTYVHQSSPVLDSYGNLQHYVQTVRYSQPREPLGGQH